MQWAKVCFNRIELCQLNNIRGKLNIYYFASLVQPGPYLKVNRFHFWVENLHVSIIVLIVKDVLKKNGPGRKAFFNVPHQPWRKWTGIRVFFQGAQLKVSNLLKQAVCTFLSNQDITSDIIFHMFLFKDGFLSVIILLFLCLVV